MEHTIEVRLATEAPREALWRVLEDLPAWPEWDPYIVSMERADGVEERPGQHWVPGTRWDERVRRGPFLPRFRLTVSGLTPGSYVEWEASYLGVRGVHGWGIEERGDRRELVSRETFRGSPLLIWPARVLLRLFRVRRMTQRSLAAIVQRAGATNGV